MFKKIFGKRPNRSLTVQESLVVLLLLGVYAGLLAGVIGGAVGMVSQAVIDKQIHGNEPYWSSGVMIALMVVFLALVSRETFRYLRRTEQRLVLADSVRTDDDELAQPAIPDRGS